MEDVDPLVCLCVPLVCLNVSQALIMSFDRNVENTIIALKTFLGFCENHVFKGRNKGSFRVASAHTVSMS